MPKISACIVAYCDYDEVCAAVRSILHYTPAPDLALYVVDNGSPDGCGRQLAETDFGDSRVTVLPLEKNIGFGKGHNYVLDRLTSDVHFILNPDILLTGDVLEDMAAWPDFLDPHGRQGPASQEVHRRKRSLCDS